MRKRRKKLKKWVKISLFIVILLTWFSSRLFLTTYNIKLTMRIQETKEKIELLKGENDYLFNTINILKNQDRIKDIALEGGLKYNDNSIIMISGDR